VRILATLICCLLVEKRIRYNCLVITSRYHFICVECSNLSFFRSCFSVLSSQVTKLITWYSASTLNFATTFCFFFFFLFFFFIFYFFCIFFFFFFFRILYFLQLARRTSWWIVYHWMCHSSQHMNNQQSKHVCLHKCCPEIF